VAPVLTFRTLETVWLWFSVIAPALTFVLILILLPFDVDIERCRHVPAPRLGRSPIHAIAGGRIHHEMGK